MECSDIDPAVPTQLELDARYATAKRKLIELLAERGLIADIDELFPPTARMELIIDLEEDYQFILRYDRLPEWLREIAYSRG